MREVIIGKIMVPILYMNSSRRMLRMRGGGKGKGDRRIKSDCWLAKLMEMVICQDFQGVSWVGGGGERAEAEGIIWLTKPVFDFTLGDVYVDE